MSDNEKIQGINLDTKFLEQSSTEELSSETRINSYWSFRENESLENMNVCDFEVNSSLFLQKYTINTSFCKFVHKSSNLVH
jgi:hypothetical protein